MSDMNVGDKVETAVFVCGKRVPMWQGIIVRVHSGYCDVDIGSLHGAAPWIVSENTSHLLKLRTTHPLSK